MLSADSSQMPHRNRPGTKPRQPVRLFQTENRPLFETEKRSIMGMTYEEARAYLARVEAKGNLLGLESVRGLLEELENPQDRLKFVHIAGTNGKGSAMAYLEQTLQEAGYRVGRYISPSVFAYEEKIRVNGEWIPKEKVAQYVSEAADAIARLERAGAALPTIFEVETAVSFLYFVDQKCDLVLLEVGMGGAGDATNVVKTTILEMFASISLDHMEFLGDTIGKIALVKSGIMKKGVPAVSDAQDPEAEVVLRERAASEGAKIHFAAPDQIDLHRRELTGQTFSYKSHSEITIPLLGTYQLRNAALALEAVDELRVLGWQLPEETVKRGFANTRWPGRFEVLRAGGAGSGKAWAVMDGAHNPDAAVQLAQSLKAFFPGRRYVYVFGIFADKEYEKVIRITAPLADRIFTIQTPGNSRALPAQELTEAIRGSFSDREITTVGEDIFRALEMADAAAGEEDVIVAFGSLSFLAEVKRYFR